MPMSEGQSLRGKVIAAVAIGLAIVLGILVVFAIDRRPRTHDAYIFAYSSEMASEISGRIVQILVTNDQDVAKGAPLFLIDPAPYEFQLRQARAQVAALKAQIALTGRQVTAQGSGVQAAESQVQKARDQLRYAEDTRKRLEPLLKPGFVTQQQLDEARTNEASAEVSVQALTQSATQARQAVGDTLSLEAQLEGAEAAEANAARNYDLTTLRAPFAGKVVGLQIAEGTFAVGGHPLFSLIKSESNSAFTGRVESLGAGVQPTDQAGPGLPVVGRDLNWVVVAQRFPVWVRLDSPPPFATHVGLTASVKVHHDGTR